ncbi:hypothetical protein ECC02_009713 [Trypanosoma cruzi]|uniref:Uncharacterized protein n=1 Tax=Trypanosoma cruzi TaxID=5693 RepID=A0A7J6XSG5_TRYCR|nr:hypothetical protein ECC02_009713 [Trypanosoma cruzi]
MESNRGDERCGRHTQRAHHMRRGQQPGMHRTPHTTHDTHSNPRQQARTHTHTHTHSPAATPTHRWKRDKQTGAAHKAPPHAHTARAVRRVGTPHGKHAHTQDAAHTATQKQRTNLKERSPHTTWIVGPREVQPIFITKIIQFPLALLHIRRTPLHAGLGTTAAAAAHTKISAVDGIMQATIYLFLFGCWQMSACFVFFLRRANPHAWVVCWGFLQGAQFVFSSCEFFLCWCSQ